jgi:RTX calcium-binding nonapeptide repeat (4 copies)
MLRRAVPMAGLMSLCFAAPASAGTVAIEEFFGGIVHVTYTDEAGVDDNVTFTSPDDRTIVATGPGVVAGPNCAPVPGGARCTQPPGTTGWEKSTVVGGPGDDTIVSRAPQVYRVFGDTGDDRLAFEGVAGGLYGGPGADVLSAAGAATLQGDAGDDHLIASRASALSGGAGSDRLDGSPQSDVIVDAGDRGTRDVIACRGGADITQGDRGDRLRGCSRRALDALSKVRHRWRVFPGPGLTEPVRLRVRDTNYVGLQAPFAECVGRACAGARLDSPPRAFRSFRIVRGGVRHRWNGRTRRTVRAGATIRIGLWFRFGEVEFTKGLEFRTRANALPRKRKRCTVTVRGRTRAVPCT